MCLDWRYDRCLYREIGVLGYSMIGVPDEIVPKCMRKIPVVPDICAQQVM